MKKFSRYIEEMSMSVTLKPKKNNMYKVTGVGKKMAAHGGIKKGEKFHDSEIDGMHDSGIKVKYEKPKAMKKESIQRRMDRMTIIATDPATGRKVVKVAPKKEIDIGKGNGPAQSTVAGIASFQANGFFGPSAASAFKGFGAGSSASTACHLVVYSAVDANIGTAAGFSLGPCAVGAEFFKGSFII